MSGVLAASNWRAEQSLGASELLAQHVLAAEGFKRSNDVGFRAIPEDREEVRSSGSTVHGEEKESPRSGPSDVGEMRPEYTVRRTVTGKSTTSIRTDTDVDALVRMLSRRTTTARSQQEGNEETDEGYENDLENIMGGIFGQADDDISKRKNVGIIWKHLNVTGPPDFH